MNKKNFIIVLLVATLVTISFTKFFSYRKLEQRTEKSIVMAQLLSEATTYEEETVIIQQLAIQTGQQKLGPNTSSAAPTVNISGSLGCAMGRSSAMALARASAKALADGDGERAEEAAGQMWDLSMSWLAAGCSRY